jgi:hypothetical protein
LRALKRGTCLDMYCNKVSFFNEVYILGHISGDKKKRKLH